MKMQMNIPPKRLEGKRLTKSEIDKYIANSSVEDLTLRLRHLHREGVLKFGVTLDPAYLKARERRDRDNSKLAMSLDVLKPTLPWLGYTVGSRVYDELSPLYSKIKAGTPLTGADVASVMRALPENIALQHLRFTLHDINWQAYGTLAAASPIKFSNKNSYDRVELDGLAIDGSVTSYRGQEFKLSFQHQQALRLLIDHAGIATATNEFFEDYWSIFTKDNYADPEATVRKLVSALRKELTKIIGYDCIENTPNEGWRLKLK